MGSGLPECGLNLELPVRVKTQFFLEMASFQDCQVAPEPEIPKWKIFGVRH